MVKYKKAFNDMMKDYQEFFGDFKKIHDNFSSDPENWEEKFNEKGIKVLRIIRNYENSLCAKSENSGFGKFSENLSEKFWVEVRNVFPLIDKVKIS